MQLYLTTLTAIAFGVSSTCARNEPVVLGRKYGGDTGAAFWDAEFAATGRQIDHASVSWEGNVITGFTLKYTQADGTPQEFTHGKTEGDGVQTRSIDIKKGDYINEIICTGDGESITQLSLFTNGSSAIVAAPNLVETAPNDEYQLGAFAGGVNDQNILTGLTTYWSCRNEDCSNPKPKKGGSHN